MLGADPCGYVQHLINDWELGPPGVRVVGALTSEVFRYFRETRRPDGSTAFSVPPHAVRSLLDQHASTVVINRWHFLDSVCRDLVREIESARSARVSANLYLSAPSSRSFGAHWDGHDVLVLQLAGRKVWKCAPPSFDNAIRSLPQGVEPKVTDVEMEMSPGDALLVPRGWWHDVRTVGREDSLHVSIAAYPYTVRDLLVDLCDELAQTDPGFRFDVGGLQPDGAEMIEHLAGPLRTLAGRLSAP